MEQEFDALAYGPGHIEEAAILKSEAMKKENEKIKEKVEEDKREVYKSLKMDKAHEVIRRFIEYKRDNSYNKLIGRTPLEDTETIESVRLVTAAYQDMLDFYNSLEAEGEAAVRKLEKQIKTPA